MTFSARTELLNEISVGRNGPTSPLVRGVGAVVGSHRKKDGTQMPWNNTFFEASCELKAPTQGVGAWAGATPVWAPLARPDPLTCYRRSGVAPAHAFLVFAG